MKVVVDTSVWSLALRRQQSNNAIADKLRDLIADGRGLASPTISTFEP